MSGFKVKVYNSKRGKKYQLNDFFVFIMTLLFSPRQDAIMCHLLIIIFAYKKHTWDKRGLTPYPNKLCQRIFNNKKTQPNIIPSKNYWMAQNHPRETSLRAQNLNDHGLVAKQFKAISR